MPIEDVPGLVERWQQASGTRQRVELLGEGTDLLDELRGSDRRALARALTARGADEVGARLDALGTGTPDDSSSLARAMLFLDREQLEGLADDLRDPSHLEALREHVSASDGGDHVDPVADTDDEVDDVDPATEVHDATTSVHEAFDRHEPPSGAPILDAPPEVPDPSNVAVATTSPTGWFDEEHPDADQTVVATFADASDARARFEAVEARHGQLTSGATLLALLDATPEGWQRRRIARRLIGAGDVHDVDASALLARFARTGDRAAVAGDLLAAHLVAPERLTELLPAATLARLSSRHVA